MDWLFGEEADLTAFRQSFLCRAFLLPELGELKSEVGWFTGLSSENCPDYRNLIENHNVIYTRLARYSSNHNRSILSCVFGALQCPFGVADQFIDPAAMHGIFNHAHRNGHRE